MLITFYALLHTIPIILAGFFADNESTIYKTAGVMVIVAFFTGSMNYVLVDLAAILIATFIAAVINDTDVDGDNDEVSKETLDFFEKKFQEDPKYREEMLKEIIKRKERNTKLESDIYELNENIVLLRKKLKKSENTNTIIAWICIFLVVFTIYIWASNSNSSSVKTTSAPPPPNKTTTPPRPAEVTKAVSLNNKIHSESRIKNTPTSNNRVVLKEVIEIKKLLTEFNYYKGEIDSARTPELATAASAFRYDFGIRPASGTITTELLQLLLAAKSQGFSNQRTK